MTPRFPGYDVLDKRNTPSWNEVTRRVIDRRLSIHPGPRFFTAAEWDTLGAICDRIVPQPTDRPPVPLPAYVDAKMFNNDEDGYRFEGVLPQRDAWQVGLKALDEVAQAKQGAPFHRISPAEQDAVLKACQKGDLGGPEWQGMSSKLFFSKRIIHDIVTAYYAHPTAWSEIGWGGPASPRGYVRMDANKRDPWEAAEAHPGKEEEARRANRHVV
jgi:hypothetical protein